MSVHGFYLVVFSAILTAAANLFLRGGVLRYGEFSIAPDRIKHDLLQLCMEPLFVSGVILYGLAAIVWFSVISIEDLSTSYPILVGMVFILVAAGSIYFFNESFAWQKVLGMLLILGGISVIARV